MIRAMVSDRDRGLETGRIAARFMNSLIDMGCAMCEKAAQETGIKDIVLSGGSFQNMYIMERLPTRLEQLGLKAWHHSRVSPNDEGIALGQLMIAQARGKDRG